MPVNVGVTPIAVGQTQQFFVAMEMTDICSTPSNTFQLSMILSSRTARDSRFKRPMLAESVASTGADKVTGGDVLEDYLFINEFMASNNSTYPDPEEETEFPDWIEIYNAAPFPVNLGGMYLTDDLSEPTKYRIPDGSPEEVTVPAHGYLVFIADGEDTQGALHTNFRLSGSGESIGLFDTDQAANQVVDIISFDEQSSNVAFGRLPSGEDTWMPLGAATPGAANTNVVLDNHIYLPILSVPSPSRSDCR